MTGVVWLASYPKSGNTWMRLLIGCLSVEGDSIDINAFIERGGMASARGPFDSILLVDSGLLTHDEIDRMRPALYRQITLQPDGEDDDEPAAPGAAKFVKVHDSYGVTPDGEALLAGAGGARGAVVIVRDPRDVAPSLANHLRLSIDAAIDFMNDPNAAFSRATNRLPTQLRQKLRSWSGHAASWLDQRDIPVHLVRYEDLKRDAAAGVAGVMRFAGAPIAHAQAQRAASLARFENLQEQERRTGFSEWFDPSGVDRKFFRRGEAGSWRSELTREQVTRIEAAHAPMMRRLGYALSAAQAV